MSIVYTTSDETGAPVLNNTPGSLDALLHAVLVTGWRVQSPSSVVVAADVATVTLAGHGYSDGRIVELAGATPAGLNGRKRITVTGANTFTFPAAGVDDGAASGAITTRRASLGWARPLSSGNVSIYTRTDPTATAMALRVDDSTLVQAGVTVIARVVGVESYTDLSTYTGPFPTNAQFPGGLYWYKGANTAAAKPWLLIGDGKRFYFFAEGASSPYSTYRGLFQFGFGDLNSYRSGDAHHCFLAGTDGGDAVGQISRALPLGAGPSSSNTFVVCRPATQLGAPVPVGSVGYAASGSVLGNTGPAYPSFVNNGFTTAGPIPVSETSAAFGHPLRGELAGCTYPMASGVGLTMNRVVLSNMVGTDREWLAVAIVNTSGTVPGCLLFDVTGPW